MEQKDLYLIRLFLLILILTFFAGIIEYGTIFEWSNYLNYEVLRIISYLIILPLVFVGFYLIGKKFDLKSNLKWSIISLFTGAYVGYLLSSCCWYFTREIFPVWTMLIRITLSPTFVYTFFIAFSALSIAYFRNKQSVYCEGKVKSEDGFSKNQVIRIIAVTWMLSLFTTLVVVNFEPAITKKSWHLMDIYEGTFQGSVTEPEDLTYEIKINADIWRISWHLYCGENIRIEDVFFFFVVSPYGNTPINPRNYVAEEDFRSYTGEWTRTADGIEHFFGSGTKWLTVKGAQIKWTVVIEEYY